MESLPRTMDQTISETFMSILYYRFIYAQLPLFWALFFGFLVETFLLFALEIFLEVMGWGWIRPTHGLRWLARQLNKGLRLSGQFLTVIFDFLGGLQKIFLWIRDHILVFIPREVIKQVWRDMKGTLGDWLKVPFAFFVGVGKGIADATIPWLTASFTFLCFILTPFIWEVTLLFLDISYRPSTFFKWMGGHLRHGFMFALGELVASLTDLGKFLKTLGRLILNMFPKELIGKAVDDLGDGITNVTTSTRGFAEGMGFLTMDPGTQQTLFYLFICVVAFIVVCCCSCFPGAERVEDAGPGGYDPSPAPKTPRGSGSGRKNS